MITYPSFLPDGRRYLYLARQRDGSSSVAATDTNCFTWPVICG